MAERVGRMDPERESADIARVCGSQAAARDKTGGEDPGWTRRGLGKPWKAFVQDSCMALAFSHDGCDCSVGEKVGRGRREAGQEDVAIIMQDALEAWPRWCLWKLMQEILYSGSAWHLMASTL